MLCTSTHQREKNCKRKKVQAVNWSVFSYIYIYIYLHIRHYSYVLTIFFLFITDLSTTAEGEGINFHHLLIFISNKNLSCDLIVHSARLARRLFN